VRTPSQLRRELVGLHVWAGSPGARRLTAAAAELHLTLARSTTQDLISGARVGGLPHRDFVRAFVMACLTHAGVEDAESTADSWDQAWLTVVQAHGQVPATPATQRTTAPRPTTNNSRYRVIFRVTAVIAVLAGIAVTLVLVTNSDDPPEASPVATTAAIQDVYCAPDGLTANWQNHHSQLYLAAPETSFAVTRHKSPTVEGCAHRLTTGPQCLEASSDTEVTESECTDRPEQLWMIENHWYYEGVMWQRLRPAHRLDLCLQQRTDEDSASTQAVLKSCGTNWIQQWRLLPAGT
jgi:hypothetical protein